MKKQRKHELSLLNVWLCLLVIFIHIASEPLSLLDKTRWTYGAILIPWRLSAFVVQAFILLSGVKMFLGARRGYGAFCLARLKTIVLPYILWVTVYYIYFMRRGYFGFSIAELARYILDGSLVSHFYFVIIIVQFYVLAPFWYRMVDRVKPRIAISAAFVITFVCGRCLPEIIRFFVPEYEFIYNDRVLTTYLLYWVAGCFIGANYERFTAYIKTCTGVISALYLLTACANAWLSLRHFTAVPIAYLEYVHFAYCVSAVLFFFMLALKLDAEKIMSIRPIREIDGVSYLVYLSHCLVIFVVNDEMVQRGIVRVSVSLPLRAAAVYTLSIGGCIAYRYLKKTAACKFYPYIQ